MFVISIRATLFVPPILSVSLVISSLISSKSVYTLFFVCRNFPHSSALMTSKMKNNN